MRGKRGFLRILEAFVAIAIIAGAMSFIYVNQIQKPNKEAAINELMRLILEDITNDNNLRKAVLNANADQTDPNRIQIENEIRIFIPSNENKEFHFSICSLNEICSCNSLIGGGETCPNKKTIYSDEISVSVTLDQINPINPKLVKLFIWEK